MKNSAPKHLSPFAVLLLLSVLLSALLLAAPTSEEPLPEEANDPANLPQ